MFERRGSKCYESIVFKRYWQHKIHCPKNVFIPTDSPTRFHIIHSHVKDPLNLNYGRIDEEESIQTSLA